MHLEDDDGIQSVDAPMKASDDVLIRIESTFFNRGHGHAVGIFPHGNAFFFVQYIIHLVFDYSVDGWCWLSGYDEG